MGAILSYVVESCVLMTILYIGYKWLLSSATFHAFNRFVLLAIYILSWTLPAAMPLFNRGGDTVIGLPVALVMVDDIVASPVTVAPPAFDWNRALIWTYLSGVTIALGATGISAMKMAVMLRRGERIEVDGVGVIVTPEAPGPFSWGGYIVLRPEDCDSDMQLVVRHELAHRQRLHWLDLAIGQLNIVVQWFSPAAYLMMHELKNVHEFQADRAAGAGDAYRYQMMLIKKTVGSSFPTFADSLNHSQIKNRLTMMMKNRTSSWRRLAALTLPAFAVGALATLSQPAVAGMLDGMRSASLMPVSESKVSDLSPMSQEITSSAVAGATLAAVAPSAVHSAAPGEEPDENQMVVLGYAAGQKADDGKKENKNVKIIAAGEARDDASGGKEGSPAIFIDDKLFKGSLQDINPDDIESITVRKNNPDYPDGQIMIYMKKAGEPEVALIAQQIAEYKGGTQALKNFVIANTKYPEGEKKDATVIVRFVISVDGSVSDIKVVRSAGEAYDKEAMRVVALTSGNWIPGSNDGKPVATQFNMPVRFKTHTGDEEKK